MIEDVHVEPFKFPKSNQRRCKDCGEIFPLTEFGVNCKGYRRRACAACWKKKCAAHAKYLSEVLKGRPNPSHGIARNKPSEQPCDICHTTTMPRTMPRTRYWNIDAVLCPDCKARLDDACQSFNGKNRNRNKPRAKARCE
jgi:hypothetical protein